MWKLTVKQERIPEYGVYPVQHIIEIVSEDLSELTMLIERLAHCKEVEEIEYTIKKVGEKNEV